MNELVLDASVVLRWAFEDEDERQGAIAITEGLISGRVRAVAPPTFLPEVAGVLVRAVRSGRMTRANAERVLEALARVEIGEVDHHGFARSVMDLALEVGLHVQDAAYLETARSAGLLLVTADRAQLEAARRIGVRAVALEEVSALGA